MKLSVNYILVLLLLGLSGCANGAKTALYGIEDDLDTGGSITSQSHTAAYYPSSVSLNFEGFVLGIDKSPVVNIADPEDIYKHDITLAGDGISEDIERIGDEPKILYISQLYEYFGKPLGKDNCAHFSTYEFNSKQGFFKPCAGQHIGALPKESYSASWQAVDILKQQLSKKLKSGDYTHLILMVMGWNTPQLESYRNFNSIMKNIDDASGASSFKPLFVGVTWPSFWESAWFDPLWKGFSYRNKANDADELGLTWFGVIARDIIGELDTDELKTVVIGHSFGARAASMGVCVGPAIDRNSGMKKEHQFPTGIDVYIGLQPAFSINRFLHKEDGIFDEIINFPDGCRSVKRIALTASKGDSAVKAQFIAKMVGDYESYHEHCLENRNDMFQCAKATDSGEIIKAEAKNKGSGETGQFMYIDASDLIRYNAPGSGGGSHSDIYRKEMGRLIWQLIE